MFPAELFQFKPNFLSPVMFLLTLILIECDDISFWNKSALMVSNSVAEVQIDINILLHSYESVELIIQIQMLFFLFFTRFILFL